MTTRPQSLPQFEQAMHDLGVPASLIEQVLGAIGEGSMTFAEAVDAFVVGTADGRSRAEQVVREFPPEAAVADAIAAKATVSIAASTVADLRQAHRGEDRMKRPTEDR